MGGRIAIMGLKCTFIIVSTPYTVTCVAQIARAGERTLDILAGSQSLVAAADSGRTLVNIAAVLAVSLIARIARARVRPLRVCARRVVIAHVQALVALVHVRACHA